MPPPDLSVQEQLGRHLRNAIPYFNVFVGGSEYRSKHSGHIGAVAIGKQHVTN